MDFVKLITNIAWISLYIFPLIAAQGPGQMTIPRDKPSALKPAHAPEPHSDPAEASQRLTNAAFQTTHQLVIMIGGSYAHFRIQM